MAWRRKAPTAPDVEWTTAVHELEPTDPPPDPGLAPPPPPPVTEPVHRTPRVDPQRALLSLCAVVAALALVATALMQRDLRDAKRRENCFLEAQFRAFADSSALGDPTDVRDFLTDCGVQLADEDEDEDDEDDDRDRS